MSKLSKPMTRGKYVVPEKKSKYKAVRCEVDGIKFPSKRQAKRYGQLKMLERAGEIKGLVLEVVHHLVVNGVIVCKYRSDFEYEENGKWIVEDSKGFKTRDYRIKAKLMKAIHNIEIRET